MTAPDNCQVCGEIAHLERRDGVSRCPECRREHEERRKNEPPENWLAAEYAVYLPRNYYT